MAATPSGADLEQKVAMLEKTMQEREKTIAELKQHIGTLTKNDDVVQVRHS